MTCLICGSENKPENRFCGSCGGPLTKPQSATNTCSSCGNINEPTYKFCGKCGAKIERRGPAAGGDVDVSRREKPRTAEPPVSSPHEGLPKLIEKPAITSETTPSRTGRSGSLDRNQDGPAKPMPAHTAKAASMSIGGPSFLGLNSDSDNSDYLLEDEGSSGGGGLRILLVILLLAGVAGAILLQVRSKHTANPKPPELAASVPVPSAENQMPSTQDDVQHDTNSAGPANRANADQHPRQSESKEEDENKVASTAKSSADISAKEMDSGDSKSGDSKSSKSKDDQAVESDVIKKPIGKKNDSVKERPPEEPRRPSTALLTAQRYLQGRGVRQNCQQGLLYLNAATKQNDPQAAVQMAALYASGHCVPQDRVQAYRWFTSANDLQPSNRWIEKNLNLLWADMTSAERRQISR